MRTTNMNARECKWLKGGEKKQRKKEYRKSKAEYRLTRRSERERMIDRACVRMEERERKREKGCNWSCVRVHVAWWRSSENATEWENEGPCIGGGVEWTVSKKNNVQTFDLPQDVCISTPLPPQRERKRKKKKGVPRYPPLSSPCVPSRNHRPPPVIAVMNHGPAGLSIIFCTV